MPPKRKAAQKGQKKAAAKKQKTETDAKKPAGKFRPKKELMDEANKLAEQNDGKLGLADARKLWSCAADSAPGVTMNEFKTLEKILDEHNFTKQARQYLDALVHKHESGTSMYKVINRKKYDRSCLDLAAHLSKDNVISKADAELLWKDVEDGPGVTLIEKETIEYVMKKFKLNDGAKKYLKEKVAEWEAAHPGAGDEATASSSSSSAPAPAPGTAPRLGYNLGILPTGGAWHGSLFGVPAGVMGLPVLSKDFSFDLESKAFGLFVDEKHIYAGDESGLVVQLAHDGSLERQLRLPVGAKCIIADSGFVFAGCNNGNLYDLTFGAPRLVAELEDFKEILWIDIHNGIMAVSDAAGNVALVNHEGETLWKKKSEGENGWMVRVRADGVYHGHSKGVTKYDLEGKQLWHRPTEGVLFGWHQGESLYAGLIEPNCFDGEIAKRLHREGAKTGDLVFSLMWNNIDDLDLHVIPPSGEHIFYGHKISADGGELDVDMNAGWGTSTEPVENIYWKRAPAGKYRVSVVSFNTRCGQKETPFELHMNLKGEKKKIEGVFKNDQADGRQEQVHFVEFAGSDDEKAEDRLPQKSAVSIACASGDIQTTFETDSSVPSVTTSPDSKMVFAAVPHAIKAFDDEGKELWKMATGSGSAMSMQYFGNKLYAVAGTKLLCLDVSQEAVDKAKAGQAVLGRQLSRGQDRTETAAVSGANELESAEEGSSGVRVHCVQQGAKVRVRPEPGQGFDENKNTQFPRNIRVAGARFLVDNLVLCGSFYRVQGNIKRL